MHLFYHNKDKMKTLKNQGLQMRYQEDPEKKPLRTIELVVRVEVSTHN